MLLLEQRLQLLQIPGQRFLQLVSGHSRFQ